MTNWPDWDGLTFTGISNGGDGPQLAVLTGRAHGGVKGTGWLEILPKCFTLKPLKNIEIESSKNSLTCM